MRLSRIKIFNGVGVYHCISRVVGGQRLLDAEAKDVFRRMLWKVADFSGVEVLTYCVLSNHFHLLVRVRSGRHFAEGEIDRAELLRRFRVLYGMAPSAPQVPTPDVLAVILAKGGREADDWRKRLLSRMGDVSEFMKTLKHRFTVWFNQRHQRIGTLWAERFKSVLVENTPFALKTVAAYIDLNPVRAHLVEDPEMYRWCGYSEAMSGGFEALKGLASVVEWDRNPPEGLEQYRMTIFGKGAVRRKDGEGMIPNERVQMVLKQGGSLTPAELGRIHCGGLSRGVILGCPEFLATIAKKRPAIGRGRRIAGAAKVWNELPVKEAESPDLVTWCRTRRTRQMLKSIAET